MGIWVVRDRTVEKCHDDGREVVSIQAGKYRNICKHMTVRAGWVYCFHLFQGSDAKQSKRVR